MRRKRKNTLKRQILIPMLALFGIVNGCRSTSDTQVKHPAQTSGTVPAVEKRMYG